MASIYGSTTKGGYKWQLRLDYTITQNEDENYSSIHCTLYVYCANGNSYNELANEAYYVICGSKTFKPYKFTEKTWYKLGSRDITVQHDDDGTKSYTLSATWVTVNETATTPASISLSETIDLPKINRSTAWIKVNGAWKKAVTWIKVNGTWKKVIPMVKANGKWEPGA